MFDPREKIALFIDGANLYATSRSLGFDIDYRKLLSSFQKRGYLLRAYYYTALVEDQEYSSIRPLIDWLDYNGYKVVTKPAKEFTDSTGRRKIKGNMDIELAVDALELAETCRPLRHLLRRRRFPHPGRSAAAQGPQGQRRLDHGLAAADDLRRSAPAGRPFHRSDVAARPRSAATPPNARCDATSRSMPTRSTYEVAARSTLKTSMLPRPAEPHRDCPLCPRLHDFIAEWRAREPDWFNAPVPTFLPPEGADSVRLLIVGLAPGLRGANRTGRPFTGDYAGDLLYRTLIGFGLAQGRYEARPDDGLELVGTAITNAVRCVPPENKPLPVEINTCRQFLRRRSPRFPNLQGDRHAGRNRAPIDRQGAWRTAVAAIRSSTARATRSAT